ncbi:MAG TPA: fibronectin type III domain-containing protein [Verrucomicrobiae bacterium]
MNAPANDVANLADDVVDGITGNPAFPAPPITALDLTTLNTTLRSAITAADAGGPTQTAAKYKAYAAVTDALRKDANYVEIQSDNDLETLLSSGYDVVSTNRAQAPLDQPVIVEISNLATTRLLVRLLSILNAKSYQVQLATAVNGPWQEAGIYTQARRIVLLGLTPGTVYFVRLRAIGGSTGYSEWSVPATLMAT